MNRDQVNRLIVPASVILATALWFFAFFISWGNFWIKISISASILAVISFRYALRADGDFRFDLKAVGQGLLSAVFMYLVFWVGKAASTMLFPFAQSQIHGIYDKGEGTPLWVIFLLLFFITGPAEEIFWRGFLQRRLMASMGAWKGWALATALYAGVHISSLNFMLVAAAAVVGAFWGLMFWRLKRLAPLIISHSLWSAFIFAVMPVP